MTNCRKPRISRIRYHQVVVSNLIHTFLVLILWHLYFSSTFVLTGIVGAPGPAGAQGPQGPQGRSGEAGPRGETGNDGQPGKNITL